MNILITIGIILAVMWVIGKIMWASQDQREINLNPNHPSKLSKKMFPVGSGTCPRRNSDRHTWDYGHFDDSFGPTDRTCKHCGKSEYKLLTGGGDWQNSF